MIINNNLLTNEPFIAAAIACCIAQLAKPLISIILREKFSFRQAFSTGGMPSSHTATVTALTTAVALQYGVGSTFFAICIVFGLIVIHDAMGIRQEAGKQAELLNQWSKIFAEIHEEGQFSQSNLKTMLGHSFSQVFFGIILGLVVGFSAPYLF